MVRLFFQLSEKPNVVSSSEKIWGLRQLNQQSPKVWSWEAITGLLDLYSGSGINGIKYELLALSIYCSASE